MAPILPGISDRPEQLEAVVRAAREAGACGIWADVVNLREGTREHFLEHLGRAWPEARRDYERLFRGRAYLPSRFGEELRDRVAILERRFEVGDRRPVRLAPPEAPAQMELTW
jgi:DNA repair photolyase